MDFNRIICIVRCLTSVHRSRGLGRKGLIKSTLIRIILIAILLAIVATYIILLNSDSNFLVNSIFGNE